MLGWSTPLGNYVLILRHGRQLHMQKCSRSTGCVERGPGASILVAIIVIMMTSCDPQEPQQAALPVVGLGFLQLLVLPGVPLLQLHLGLLLPL